MTAPIPEERVSKIGQYVILRCSEAYSVLKNGVLRLERLFDLNDPASFQENTHLLLLGHHVQLLAAKIRRLQVYLLAGESITLKDSWNTMKALQTDPTWEALGRIREIDQNVYTSLAPIKRYLDIFDRSVHTINEREMFVTMGFPPDILPTNTRDLITFVVNKFQTTARFFAAVQVFLILKNFAADFPPVLTTELKNLKTMSDHGFLSEQEYSDRRLLLFDKHVPPRVRANKDPLPSARTAAKAQSGDEALAEVTRMLEESMRRSVDRRASVMLEGTPTGYPNGVLAASTPPAVRPPAKTGNGVVDTTYRRKTVNFDHPVVTAGPPSLESKVTVRRPQSNYTPSSPSYVNTDFPPAEVVPHRHEVPTKSATLTSIHSTPPTADTTPQRTLISKSATLTSVHSSPPAVNLPAEIVPKSRSAPAPAEVVPKSKGAPAATPSLPPPLNFAAPPPPPIETALKLYHDAIYAPVEPVAQPESAYSPRKQYSSATLSPRSKPPIETVTAPLAGSQSLADSRKRTVTAAPMNLSSSSSTPPPRPSSSYHPAGAVPASTSSPTVTSNVASLASTYAKPAPVTLDARPGRTAADLEAEIAARRRYFAQLDKQKEQQGKSLSESVSSPAKSTYAAPAPAAPLYAPLASSMSIPKAAPPPASSLPPRIPPVVPQRDYDTSDPIAVARRKYELQQLENAETLRKKEEMMRMMNERSASQLAEHAMLRMRQSMAHPAGAQADPLRQVPSAPAVNTMAAYPPPKPLAKQEPSFTSARSAERATKARTLEYKSSPVMIVPATPSAPAQTNGSSSGHQRSYSADKGTERKEKRSSGKDKGKKKDKSEKDRVEKKESVDKTDKKHKKDKLEKKEKKEKKDKSSSSHRSRKEKAREPL